MLTPNLTDEETSSTTEISTIKESARPPEPFLPFSCGLPHERKSAQRVHVGDTVERTDTIDDQHSSGDLEEAVVFAGTGLDVRRVLKRAMRSHLYGRKRATSAIADLGSSEMMYDGEEPFRILVIGGSGEPRSLLTAALLGLLIPQTRTQSQTVGAWTQRQIAIPRGSCAGSTTFCRWKATGTRNHPGLIR